MIYLKMYSKHFYVVVINDFFYQKINQFGYFYKVNLFIIIHFLILIM